MRSVLLALLLAAPVPAAATLLDDSASVDERTIQLVRQAAVAALDGSTATIDDAARELEALDDARRDGGQAPTGLTDDVRLLAAGLRVTRDARRDALEEVLDADPDPVVERIARHALEQEDDAAAADRLLSDDRHNRRATVVNEAIRPLGIFSGGILLAAVNPFLAAGSAVDSVVTTAVNLYHYNDLSPREREALVRYRRQLARDPHTTAAPEIADAIRGIHARRAKAQCTDAAERAAAALEAGDLDRARFFVGSAARSPDCDDEIAATRGDLAPALAARARREEAARWPADELEHPPVDERADYEAMAAATVLARPSMMMEAAQRFAADHPDSPHAPAATLVVGVARDLDGQREEARAALGAIADDRSGPGRAAQAMLASPRFHGLDAMATAESRHAREVAQYVLIGSGPDGRTALYTAARAGTQGVQAAQTFGLLNVIGMATRAWGAWRKDPASNQRIIDEGEQFLAREPASPEVSDVHERLATAYERAGVYDRALMHYRAVQDAEPSRIETLEGKVADQLLENARKGDGEPALLAAIVHYYPQTDAAEEARKALDKLPRPGAIPLSRDTLLAHPALLGPTGLDLDPRLLDGDVSNGELAEDGVMVSPGTLRLSVQDRDGGNDRTEERPLSPEGYGRARAAAEDALYAKALTTDPRDRGAPFERYIPVFFEGSFGESGVAVAPGIKLRPNRSEDRALYEE